ncbi:MAG: hypothetical protein ACREUL_01620 [Steroidobacteraceae bacterium]
MGAVEQMAQRVLDRHVPLDRRRNVPVGELGEENDLDAALAGQLLQRRRKRLTVDGKREGLHLLGARARDARQQDGQRGKYRKQ